MSKTRTEAATKLWKTLASNLEDRSILDMGSFDDALAAEIAEEQIKAIDAAMLAYGRAVSPYRVD